MTHMTEKKVNFGGSRDSDNVRGGPGLYARNHVALGGIDIKNIILHKESHVIAHGEPRVEQPIQLLIVSACQRLKRRSVRGKLGREETNQGLGLISQPHLITPFFQAGQLPGNPRDHNATTRKEAVSEGH